MIKLNKSIGIGDTIVIPEIYYTRKARAIAGKYVVKSLDPPCLVREDGFVLYVDDGPVIEYFGGEHVDNPPMWEGINGDEYQPDLDDYDDEYFSEYDTDMEFEFGSCDDAASITMYPIGRMWCYGKMPWNA